MTAHSLHGSFSCTHTRARFSLGAWMGIKFEVPSMQLKTFGMLRISQNFIFCLSASRWSGKTIQSLAWFFSAPVTRDVILLVVSIISLVWCSSIQGSTQRDFWHWRHWYDVHLVFLNSWRVIQAVTLYPGEWGNERQKVFHRLMVFAGFCGASACMTEYETTWSLWTTPAICCRC